MSRESREPAEGSREWLRRIRRGDADAFDAVARETAPRLFHFALRLTGRRDEAEDLVQETLVRALPAVKRFEGRAALATYLARALGNLWKNRLRSRDRSPVVALEDRFPDAADPPVQDPGPSALEALERDERRARLRRAMEALEPDRRLTLLLREVEGLSYEAIAEATAVAVGTVRSRLARAREELRRTMQRLEAEERS